MTTAALLPTNCNNSKPCWSAPEIELRAVRGEKLRRNLYEFVLQAWPIVEPATPFVNGIHVEAICQHLQAVSQGKIGNLIINVPPGHDLAPDRQIPISIKHGGERGILYLP